MNTQSLYEDLRDWCKENKEFDLFQLRDSTKAPDNEFNRCVERLLDNDVIVSNGSTYRYVGE